MKFPFVSRGRYDHIVQLWKDEVSNYDVYQGKLEILEERVKALELRLALNEASTRPQPSVAEHNE